MAEIRLQINTGLTRAEALRDILKTSPIGEIVAFRYNNNTGNVNLTTRAFPAFPEVLPESESSQILNASMENIGVMRAVNDQDRIALDAREAAILARERELDQREAALPSTDTQSQNIGLINGIRNLFGNSSP